MADNVLQNIGQGLQSFLTGTPLSQIQNQAEQQRIARQQQFMQLDNQRKQALFDDARTVNSFLKSGQPTQALNVLSNRLSLIERIGGDPSDTMEIANFIAQGDLQGATNLLDSVEQAGVMGGFLQDMEAQRKKSEVRPTKTAQQKNFEQLAELERTGTPQEVETFKRMLKLVNETKLSSKAEKAIIDSQDAFFKSGQQARKMELLADDIARLDIGGGLASTVSETFKEILGSTDEVSSLRKRFNAIRSSQATSNLPPGPASDKDIALALSGFPKENANAKTIISFLEGQSKLARIDEKFNEFKAEYIGENNSVKGLLKEWQSRLNSEDFILRNMPFIKPENKIKGVQSVDVTTLSDDELFR